MAWGERTGGGRCEGGCTQEWLAGSRAYLKCLVHKVMVAFGIRVQESLLDLGPLWGKVPDCSAVGSAILQFAPSVLRDPVGWLCASSLMYSRTVAHLVVGDPACRGMEPPVLPVSWLTLQPALRSSPFPASCRFTIQDLGPMAAMLVILPRFII